MTKKNTAKRARNLQKSRKVGKYQHNMAQSGPRDPVAKDPMGAEVSRGPLFFADPTLPHVRHGTFLDPPHYTTPSPTCDMGLFSPNALQIWPQKGSVRPLLTVKIVPWQATAPWRSVSRAPAWAERSTGTRVHPAERSHLARQPTFHFTA